MTHTFPTRTGEQPDAHVIDLLPEFVGNTLASATAERVQRHLAQCAACAAEHDAWRAVAGGVHAAVREVSPEPTLLMGVFARIDAEAQSEARINPTPIDVEGLVQSTTGSDVAALSAVTPGERSRRRRYAGERATGTGIAARVGGAVGHAWYVLLPQLRLLPRVLWVASAVAFALAALYAVAQPRPGSIGDILTFALPLIAASGTAFIYGPEIDPALELTSSTPTSARTVLFSRFVLLFGFDALLALGVTVLVATLRDQSLWTLATLWAGPMALLASGSLVLSLLFSPVIAAGSAAALWLLRVVPQPSDSAFQPSLVRMWHTSPQVLILSCILLGAAVLYVPHQERLARRDE